MQVLSDADIKRMAPAVFAEEPASFMSDRYGFVKTDEVINVLRGEGYQVVKAQQDCARKRDLMSVRHALTLRHESALQQEAVVGEYVPQILLINSHNGRTKMSMHAGLFRFVCANGMVIGDTTMKEALRHSRSMADQIIEKAKHMAALSVPLAQKIESWQKVELTEAQAQTFAQQAAILRFGATRAAAYQPEALLELRRPEDEGRSLWRVFNRVQENTTMQQLSGRSANNRAIRSRALDGIGQNTVFNERLWELADKFVPQ